MKEKTRKAQSGQKGHRGDRDQADWAELKKMLKCALEFDIDLLCVLNLNVNVAKLLSHYTSCRNPSLIRVSSGTQKAL